MEPPDERADNDEQQQQVAEEEEEPDPEPGFYPEAIDPDDEAREMHRALVRIGLSPIAAQEFIMNGITSTEELRTLEIEDLNRLIKQIHRDNMNGLFIPYKAQQRIYVIRYWTNRQYILGRDYDATSITRQLAMDWIRHMKDEKEDKDVTKVTADLIKAPEVFKKDTKWCSWKESVQTYLNAQLGQVQIPLAYIIHENDEPIQDVAFTTVHEELVQGVVLIGAEFNSNNGKVYDFLQSLTLNGPAWPWINVYQRARDGRGAWKALIAYYEGDAMKTRTKQECYQAIAKANYQGQRRNYDFSTYVATHQQAHQDLLRLEEPIPENKKVPDFLAGITDLQCASIKLNILSNQLFMNDFLQAVYYIASAIDMIQKNAAPTFR
jgi:hypothetical protein